MSLWQIVIAHQNALINHDMVGTSNMSSKYGSTTQVTLLQTLLNDMLTVSSVGNDFTNLTMVNNLFSSCSYYHFSWFESVSSTIFKPYHVVASYNPPYVTLTGNIFTKTKYLLMKPTPAITFEIMFRMPAKPTSGQVAATLNDQYLLLVLPSGNICICGNGNNNVLVSSPILDASKWYHVVIDTTGTVIINGNYATASIIQPFTGSITPTSFGIGIDSNIQVNNSAHGSFMGNIAMCRLHNYAFWRSDAVPLYNLICTQYSLSPI
jgi:hypothetical protein